MQRGCWNTGATARNKAPFAGGVVRGLWARAAMMASADNAAAMVTVRHAIIIGSRPRRRGVDRLAHPRIGPATSDIGYGRVDIGIARALDLRQQGRRRHDHSGLAVAAL